MRYELRKGKDVREDTDASINYLRSFKKGDTKVRFLDDPDEWAYFEEHFTADNKSFMCLGSFDKKFRDVCPGCVSENDSTNRYSRRYATCLLVVDWNRVLPYRIPVSLKERLDKRLERNDGTLTNRDMVVIKSGSGLETDYDVDMDERYKLTGKEEYESQRVSVLDILIENFEEQNGPIEDYVGKEGKEDVEESKPKRAPRKVAKKEEPVEDPPSEPSSESDDAGSEMQASETVQLTENEIRGMNMTQLYKLSSDAGIDVDDCETKDDIVEVLLKGLAG